jgi:hypothetical protein
MKDAYQVLRQKEADLVRVRHEIESLLITASLLRDEPISEDLNVQTESSTEIRSEHEAEPKATGTEGLSSSVSDSRPGFWTLLTHKR